MPRFFIRNPSFYDVDAEDERQRQALLNHINRMREQQRERRPGLRPTAGQAFWFFAKMIGISLLVVGIVALVWVELVGWFSL